MAGARAGVDVTDVGQVEDVARAAQVLADAEALVVSAGAGMGVDSGLPDFRGEDGFWQAYPPYRALGLTFHQAASPSTLRSTHDLGDEPPDAAATLGAGACRPTLPHLRP